MAAKGYNMSSLAEELHIGRQAVQRLMRGHDCKLSTMERIAHVMGVGLHEIFPPPPPKNDQGNDLAPVVTALINALREQG